MLKWIVDLFKSDKKKLSEKLVDKREVLVANKEEYYHEIMPLPGGDFLIRIYSRDEGFVEDFITSSPHETALRLLKQYNKG